MVCIPPSLYQILCEIFLNLSQYFSTYKGVKILKYLQCEKSSFAGFFNTTIVGENFENS